MDNEERTKKKKDRRVYGTVWAVMGSFKTLEQLLQEQSRGEETDEVKPIVFTDHTGRQAQSRVWGENDLSSVNRNAVGLSVAGIQPGVADVAGGESPAAAGQQEPTA